MRIEKLILENLIHDSQYASLVGVFLKKEYFRAHPEKVIFSEIQKYLRDYNKSPGVSVLANLITERNDLNETSLEQALIDIAAFEDERGLKINAQARKLIIPPALQFVADRLLESQGRVGTADNDINAVRNMGMVPEGYTVNHYLTDTDAFFLKTDVPNGLKHFVRTPVATNMEGDFETGNVRYKARERYSFGFSDWRGIFGSPGA